MFEAVLGTSVTVNSPQGADEAIDGALDIQRHDISDMQEAGGRVRHPAAGSGPATEGAGTGGENFLLSIPLNSSENDTHTHRTKLPHV